jgi:hypothetical protein
MSGTKMCKENLFFAVIGIGSSPDYLLANTPCLYFLLVFLLFVGLVEELPLLARRG